MSVLHRAQAPRPSAQSGREEVERSARALRLAYICVGLAFVTGLLLGVRIVRVAPEGTAAALVSTTSLAEVRNETASAHEASGLVSAATSAPTQPPSTQPHDPTTPALRELTLDGLLDQQLDAASAELIRGLIAGMSELELIDTVSGTALFSEAELEDISDVRGFVERLVSIALSGVVAPPEEIPPQAMQVEFSTSVESDNAPTAAREIFGSDSDRIYAVFPTEQYGLDSVLVKWQRLDEPELLVFDRYPIGAMDRDSYVWLSQPEGWNQGAYEVTIYAAEESLDPIAVGFYEVEGLPPLAGDL